MTSVRIRGANSDIERYKGKTMWRYRVQMAVYKPRIEAGNRSFPHGLQKEPTLPSISVRPPVQNCKKINVKLPHLLHFVTTALIQTPSWGVCIKFISGIIERFHAELWNCQAMLLDSHISSIPLFWAVKALRTTELLKFIYLLSLHCKIQCSYLRSLLGEWDFFFIS